MLTRRQTGIALRCSSCGNANLFPVSLFALKSGRREFQCVCGNHAVAVTRKNSDVWLQLACFLCDGVHLFKFTDKAFWSREVKSILCPDTGAEIGYVGPMWNLVKMGRFRDEAVTRMSQIFDEPEQGKRLLSALVALDERNNLVCSHCGNPVEVEAYPKGVEIWCQSCGSTVLLPPERPDVGDVGCSLFTCESAATTDESKK